MDVEWIKIAGIPKDNKPFVAENSIAEISIDGKRLYLTYFKGSYYAGEQRCPHAGALLTQGWLNGDGDIVCPYHRFCFDLETGKNTDGEGFYVQTYPVEVRENGIFMGMPKKKWWQFW
ncbi:MAG: Rieske 2Fe-2S domain-containing protein [Chitinophagales bacterium]